MAKHDGPGCHASAWAVLRNGHGWPYLSFANLSSGRRVNVDPGWIGETVSVLAREHAHGAPSMGAESAYKGDGKIVIVVVNTGTASMNQNFVLGSGTASQISSWQTTANSNMAAGQTYQVSGGSFTAALPGQS